ncbi:guanylate kinase isoform X2 [Ctenocephalides felis]|nr:guanylate kinase isoform X2 [Ctenocephalides felis]
MVLHGPRPLVLCGPSGSGKSTLLKKLFEEFPNTFGFSVSHTTRQPRVGEEDGVHYHFTTKEEMQKAIDAGQFLETACFSGNLYGTSKRAVEDVRRAGKVCVLDIEVQGVMQVKQTDLDPVFVFVKPPSMAELEKRLRDRNTETEESLQKRLNTAKSELAYGEEPGNFDIVITNDNFDKAFTKLRDFLEQEFKKQTVEGRHIQIHRK